MLTQAETMPPSYWVVLSLSLKQLKLHICDLNKEASTDMLMWMGGGGRKAHKASTIGKEL